MKKLTHEQLLLRQATVCGGSIVPLIVILDNLRSTHNVGSLFRTCDGAGVSEIWLGGITCYPPDARLAKTALGAQDHVAWRHVEDVCVAVQGLKEIGYQIIVLEQTDESHSYSFFKPTAPVCLVVGNEISGVSEQVVQMADVAVDIEMRGVKNSLNVSVAAGIVVYEISRKLRDQIIVN